MAEPVLDATKILATLARHNVRFVVIGGLAALLHGAPYQTEDCDITPEEVADNLARLSAALRELRALVWNGEAGMRFVHDGRSLQGARVWNLVTRYGRLDIAFRPAGTSGYADLVARAVEVDADGARFSVASLGDVIRSKEASGRAKDDRVLPLLRRMLVEGIEMTRDQRQ